METVASALPSGAATRAAWSRGASGDSVHDLVARVVHEARIVADTLIDVGCGSGRLSATLAGCYRRYVGVDLVCYDGFPARDDVRFVQSDLNNPRLPMPDAAGDLVVAVETIEHVENPRAFVRELVRIARPGATIVITTPNQLSLLSKLSLVLKNQFPAFQAGPGLYPSHVTALLEEDLRRIAQECGLSDSEVRYTDSGRIPFTARHWPAWLGMRGRSFSDNVLLRARRK